MKNVSHLESVKLSDKYYSVKTNIIEENNLTKMQNKKPPNFQMLAA